ncbi:MAG: CBS domain-containing protein [Alphaproteobacteria bacterium]|jgi:CBS domain-containing protein|nr:CBS domain-containing protein [Alphaproteobacteria bacterium]
MTNGPVRSPRGPTVADAMRREIVVIDAAAAVAVAAQRMRDHEVGCLPVLENGWPVGMVTDRDLVVRGLAFGADLSRRRVGEVMSTGPLAVTPDRPIEEAWRLMAESGVQRLMVVDAEFGLIGLVSWHDLGAVAEHRPRAREVGFYRHMVDSHGHPHRIELCRLYVSPGVPASEVEPVAIERFETTNGRTPWRQVADDYEVAGV